MLATDPVRCYACGMKLTLFRSIKEPDLFGFMADSTGSNLPDEFGPWCRAGEGTPAQAYAGDSLSGGVASSDPVTKAVERDGFYLARRASQLRRPRNRKRNADGQGRVHRAARAPRPVP
jgi:hypothetical protein